MTHGSQRRCIFLISERRLKKNKTKEKDTKKTSDDLKRSRMYEIKTSCTLPTSDLDSPPGFWPWLSVPVIIAQSAAHVLACLLPDWLWKHLWFEKKFSGDMHQSQRHIILRHALQTLWLRVYLPFTTAPIFSFFSFSLLLSSSLWMYLVSFTLIWQVTAEQLIPRRHDCFPAKVKSINRYVWEKTDLM